ncbi:MAG: hypothetical protein FWG36_09220 [Oscillospiraceae bacterium]|nr:hypothetical protein [Oscillospiraceae bacterium]
MPDYKTMYFQLFNSVTDAITSLQKAQQDVEDVFINGDEEIPEFDVQYDYS